MQGGDDGQNVRGQCACTLGGVGVVSFIDIGKLGKGGRCIQSGRFATSVCGTHARKHMCVANVLLVAV